MSAIHAFDVIVVGAGLAGYRAALRAAALGSRVAVVERMPSFGGSSILAGGFFAFAGTELQRSRNITDTDELLRKDLLELGHGANDPALVEAYVKHQLEEYQYIVGLGTYFMELQPSSGHSVPRGHRADPKQLMNILDGQARAEKNISLFFSTRALRLTKTTGSDRINTVLARAPGGEASFVAGKGIILSSGGFSRAKDLLQVFAPHVRRSVPAGGLGNEGDGLKMAWEHGAAFADLGYVNGTFGTYPYPEADELPAVIFPVYRGGICVNKQAKRFISESKSYKSLGEAVLLQDDGVAYQIFDQKIMDQAVAEVPSYNFRAIEAKGRISKADTLPELASKLGIPANALSATLELYNRDAALGVDSHFGRTSLSHTYGNLATIDTPPYYGFPSTAMLSTTYGGLRVNAGMQVLNIWGDPIPGLFAAGEIMGGFHGESYMTGSALGKALIFGRIAGESAAAA